MAFPTSPTNGQTATQNGILYTYASATNSWTRTVSPIANLTITGNVTSGNASLGNLITGNYFSGNGSTITYITGSNVSGQVGNALIAGTVYIGAQPNITSTGTLTSVTVTGNVTAGNLKTDNLLYANGTTWTFSSYSNTQVGAYLPTYSGLVGGTLSTAAQPNITSTGTLTSVTVTGNVTAGNLKTDNLLYSNGVAWTFSSYSNTQVGAYLPTYSGLVGGTLSTAAQPNITSVGTITTLSSGTITISANSNIAMSGSLSQISGANLLSGTYLTGTLTTAAQPNITSTGTLSSITVTANVSAGNVLTNNLLYANGTAWSLGGGGGATLNNDTTTNANTFYPTMANNATSGTLSTAAVSSTKLYFNPSTGTLNSTVFNSISDENAKTNIVKIVDALSKLSTLGGYTYMFIDGNEPSAGLLAQQVQQVLPEAVKYNPDTNLLSLNYNAVMGLVVEAINELEQRVTGLENGK